MDSTQADEWRRAHSDRGGLSRDHRNWLLNSIEELEQYVRSTGDPGLKRIQNMLKRILSDVEQSC